MHATWLTNKKANNRKNICRKYGQITILLLPKVFKESVRKALNAKEMCEGHGQIIREETNLVNRLAEKCSASVIK